jgi:hypothetical protein
MLGEVIRKRAVPEIPGLIVLDVFSIKALAITRFYPAGKPEVADRLTFSSHWRKPAFHEE